MEHIKRWFRSAYEKRLRSACPPGSLPEHVGFILDGNRRWAARAGTDVSTAYVAGGRKLTEVLEWCDEAGIRIVTSWMLPSDSLQRSLCAALEQTIDTLVAAGRWRIVHIGSTDLLPSTLTTALRKAEDDTKHLDGLTVNIAVGYDGRTEVIDALCQIMNEGLTRGYSQDEIAEQITIDEIAKNLYTGGLPDPDLVIRASGQQRISGFLLWQAAHAEFYFCEALWPDFRSVDFWRSMRSYATRERRYGR